MADRKRSHPDWKYGGSRMTHELHPIEPIPSRLRPRETLKRRAVSIIMGYEAKWL